MKSFVPDMLAFSVLVTSGIARAQDPTATGPFTVLTASYDYGDQAFTCSGTGCDVPTAEIRAEVYYPSDLAAGPFPLILFLHGRHRACYNPNTGASVSLNAGIWPCSNAGSDYIPIPSYRGYDYVGRVLASHGYIVASVSADGINAQDYTSSNYGIIARAMLLDRHFAIWSEFNTTGSASDPAPFAADFIGAVDLHRAGTMGHSRGGDGVHKHFALFNGTTSDYSVRAVLPIGPTNFSNQIISGVNLGVLLGYCDGDVYTLEGTLMYDRGRYVNPTDPSNKFTFLAIGGNHNFFNSVWTPACWASPSPCWLDSRGLMPAYPATVDDANSYAGDPFCEPGSTNRLTDAAQRAVGLAYAVAFFRSQIGGETAFLPLLRGDVAPPSSVDPNVYIGFHPPVSERLDLNRLNDDSELTQTTLVGTGNAHGHVTATGVTATRCGFDISNPCFSGESREAHWRSLVLANPTLSRLRTVWSAPTDSFTNELPEGARDVSAFDTLQFRAGVDYLDTNNPSTTPTEFSVTLTDGSTSASVSTVSQSGINDLYFPPSDAAPTTVMNTLRFPLSLFAGVNLADVHGVTFQYNRTSAGTVLFSDIAFTGQPANPAGAFPTADPNDGKLLTVTGQGVASIDIPAISLFIAVPQGQQTFDVAIFDGDQSSHFDFTQGAPTNTCFRLMSDPNKNGLVDPGEEVIQIKSDSFFADGAYTTLYSGLVHASATNVSGAHIYRLDVVTGPGAPTATDCPTADATKTIINGFKVRSSGQVSIEYGDFSFIAADALGPFTSSDPYMSAGADTTYNGAFDFYLNVPSVATPADFTLTDSDADFLGDSTPGVAAGANYEIRYHVFDPAGNHVFTDSDVSGNYDVLTGDLDIESNSVPTGGVGGMWRWRWNHVLTENNIHVWPPTLSPPRAAVYGSPIVAPVKVTAAQPLEYWLDHADQIGSLLPIWLGTSKHSALKIRDLDDALCILDAMTGDHTKSFHGRHGGCHCHKLCGKPDSDFGHIQWTRHDGKYSSLGTFGTYRGLRGHRYHHHTQANKPLELLQDLTAALLVAELNVALDASRGQDLTPAYVYGRTETVGEVLKRANDILSKSIAICDIPANLCSSANLLVTLLEAINDGEVTFVSPDLEPGPAASSVAQSSSAASPSAPRSSTKQSGKTL